MNKLLAINIVLFLALIGLGIAFAPYILKAMLSLFPKTSTLIALTPQDGFVGTFVVATLLSLLTFIPIATVSAYLYVKPALYENEIKFAKDTVLLGVSLFFIGIIFGFASYLNFAIPFFTWFNNFLGLQNYWSFYSLVIQSLMASLTIGIVFLFPVILNNLLRFGIIKIEDLKKNRKLFYLGSAAVIIILPFLPNAIPEQIALFCPIVLMYEGVIFWNRNKNITTVPGVASG